MGLLPKLRTSSYARVLGYVRPYRKSFAGALACMVVFGASDGAVPFLVKHVLDGVFAERDENLLYLLPIVLVVFALVRGLADYGQQFGMSRIGHLIVRDLRNALQRRLLVLSPSYFVQATTAGLLSRVTSDVVLVRTLLTDSLAAVIRDSIRILALLVAAIYLDPLLACIAVVVFPLGIFPVYKFGKAMRRLSRRGQDAIGHISVLLQEVITGNRVVKVFGREEFEKDRFEDRNEELTQTFVKSERVRAVTGPINEVLATVVISAVILYGGYSVIGGVRSQGEFIAFLLAVFLLYDPFKKLSRVHNTVQQGMAGAERLFEVLDQEPDIKDPVEPLPLGRSNSIELAGVSYQYPGSKEIALSDISLKIEEGEKVALVGFSGSGKSTLVDLLPRFIDPTQGIIRIGGVDIRRVALTQLRERIAMVTQHTVLFNDTVFNNIAYGDQNADLDRVRDAARAAFALDFVERLPKGFDTVIGESGFTLSGGERQRLAIARAFLKNAPILILDEATAALDNQAEREVQAAFEMLERNRTSVVIAHRLSTVRNADSIVVMSGGRIVEQGSHSVLLENQGEYAKLYALQFESDEQPESISAAVGSGH